MFLAQTVVVSWCNMHTEDFQLNTIGWGFCVSHFAKNENCLADFLLYAACLAEKQQISILSSTLVGPTGARTHDLPHDHAVPHTHVQYMYNE